MPLVKKRNFHYQRCSADSGVYYGRSVCTSPPIIIAATISSCTSLFLLNVSRALLTSICFCSSGRFVIPRLRRWVLHPTAFGMLIRLHNDTDVLGMVVSYIDKSNATTSYALMVAGISERYVISKGSWRQRWTIVVIFRLLRGGWRCGPYVVALLR